jgi:hypothetical protein
MQEQEDIDIDIKKYSLDELRQLKELLTQSQEHYLGLLKDEKLMASLKEGDLMALKLCLAETETQIKELDDEVVSRNSTNDHKK